MHGSEILRLNLRMTKRRITAVKGKYTNAIIHNNRFARLRDPSDEPQDD